MINPACWFEIYVNDIDRAKKFYQTVFNTTLTRLDTPDSSMQMWVFSSDMQRYGATGTLVQMQGIQAGGNSTVVYFTSDDCAIEAARIEQANGKIHMPKTSIGEYGNIVLGIDTEGNIFGIHSMA
ncbi:VOC family protein [Acinetobacter stercoris]|uniref:Glyoxalase-like domain protein n=1 Tax=Acinetobacter stercoris TaxID=2126983 RepID=A0A2U3MUK9_9GAMM|nr:VOC family protein [Acinetobacter stercoris]SPL69055.1 Glyoxalase-like domain protein [Acinetobacter stercoris]